MGLGRCWWDRHMGQSLWKTAWQVLRRLNTELPYDPGTPLLRMYAEEF